MIALVVLYLAAGVVLGVVHFAALQRNVRAYAERGVSGALVALHAARLVLVGLAFFWLARRGGALVLATLAGFTLARVFLLRRRRERG